MKEIFTIVKKVYDEASGGRCDHPSVRNDSAGTVPGILPATS